MSESPEGSANTDDVLLFAPTYVTDVNVSSHIDGHTLTFTQSVPTYGTDGTFLDGRRVNPVAQLFMGSPLYQRTTQMLVRNLVAHVGRLGGPEPAQAVANELRKQIDEALAEVGDVESPASDEATRDA